MLHHVQDKQTYFRIMKQVLSCKYCYVNCSYIKIQLNVTLKFEVPIFTLVAKITKIIYLYNKNAI